MAIEKDLITSVIISETTLDWKGVETVTITASGSFTPPSPTDF